MRELFLQELLDLGPHQFTGEHELVHSIARLSENFTVNREDLAQYWSDPKLVSAYLAFYFPTNYPKFFYLMNELNIPDSFLAQAHFVDMGTGPGTYLLAYLDFMQDKGIKAPKVWAVESAAEMRRLCSKTTHHFHPQQEMAVVENIEQVKVSGPVFINFGHSLNEMGVEKVFEAIEKLQAQWIFMIEPGTPHSFQLMLELRTLLFARDFQVHFPCPRGQSPCPLDGKSNWCHQLLSTHFHPELERLFQKVKRDRLHMPLIAQAFARHSSRQEFSPQEARLLQVVRETKFSYELETCVADYDSNHLQEMVVLKKNQSKDLLKHLRRSPLGKKLTFQKVKERREGLEVILDEVPETES